MIITNPNEATPPSPEATLINTLETEAGLDLTKEIKGQYQNDPAFKPIIDKPKDYRNFKIDDN